MEGGCEDGKMGRKGGNADEEIGKVEDTRVKRWGGRGGGIRTIGLKVRLCKV